jgi:hypothetical protein
MLSFRGVFTREESFTETIERLLPFWFWGKETQYLFFISKRRRMIDEISRGRNDMIPKQSAFSKSSSLGLMACFLLQHPLS